MSEWKEYTVDNLIKENVLAVGDGYRAKNSELSTSGIPFARAGNINGGFNFEKADFFPTDNLSLVKDKKSRPWDIVFTSKGTVGRFALVEERTPEFVYSPQLCYWRSLDPSKIDPRFLFYWMQSREFIDQVDVVKGQTDMADYVNLSDQRKMRLKIPGIDIQKAVASVLTSLDDKIDLLHRQNQTLEKMAETLFRQWFVEEAKEEWEEGTLDNILTIKGGTTPSTSEPKYWNGTIHWTSPKDITTLSGIYLFDTERKITELGLSKIGSGLMPKGTLLMSSRAPVGVLAFCEVPVAINQGYIAIIDDKGYSKEFIYLWLKTNLEVVHNHSNGSTFMEISKSTFKTLALQIPPKQTVTDFQLLIEPLFEKIKINEIQVGSLTSLRDTLLPKLMSGEVRVDF